MVLLHENVVGIDSAIFMHPTIWKASGHVDAFNDPLIDNRDSKKRYRADVLIEEYAEKLIKKHLKKLKRPKPDLATSSMKKSLSRPIHACFAIDKKSEKYCSAWENRLPTKI